MLEGEGLHPSAKGVRMSFPEGTVTDGPFAETKELIAGYWLWEVGSMQEAIDWLRRSPFREHPEGDVEITRSGRYSRPRISARRSRRRSGRRRNGSPPSRPDRPARPGLGLSPPKPAVGLRRRAPLWYAGR
jgi:hypothetical protein